MSEAIPIINALTGEQTGTITVTEDGEPIIEGKIILPWGDTPWVAPETVARPAQTDADRYIEAKTFPYAPPAPRYLIEPPDPELGERLNAVFAPRSLHQQLLADPKYAEAAARGLRVHERALELSASGDIEYADALVKANAEIPQVPTRSRPD